MAELIGILASAATIAELGAQSSLALFEVVRTIKNAREEIAQIAAEMSDLSGTVVMLQHLLNAYQQLYTPVLLTRVQSILDRFYQVDTDLKKLTGKKKKLKSLRWFFEGPKAKGLLRKVEGIKSSLSLVINIILLAADQESRAAINKNPYRHSGNRFRKIAETVVQTHRLAIERAKKESTSNPTEKRRRYNSELQRWQAGSQDTATWLYELVFVSKHSHPTVEPAVMIDSKGLEGPRNATVEDEDEEQTSVIGHVGDQPEENVASPEQTSELVLWSEPSPVLDMLLESWTHLSPDQIQASRSFYPSKPVRNSEAWTEGLEQRVLEYERKERGKQRDNFESQYRQNSQRWNSSVQSNSNSEGAATRSEKLFHPVPRTSGIDWQYKGTSENSLTSEDSLSEGSSGSGTLDHIEQLHGTGPPRRPAARAAPMEPRQIDGHLTPNPFDAGYNGPMPRPYPPPMSNSQVPYPQMGAPFPNYFAPPPYYPSFSQPLSPPPRTASPIMPAPPPPPPLPTKDIDSLLATLEERLIQHEKKSQAQSERMENLRHRILEEQISQLQSDRNPPVEHPSTTDNSMDNESFLRLENLLLEQSLEQVKRFEEAEATWKAERAEVEAKAAKASEESKKLMEEEIAQAKAAKNAAERTLKFAEEQAAKQAREKAEEKATKERRKVQEDYEARIEDYEDRLDSFTQQWQAMVESKPHSAAPIPVRHTRVSQGNRQIEVSEYATRLEQSTSRYPFPTIFVDRGIMKSKSSFNEPMTRHSRTPSANSYDWPADLTSRITRQWEDKAMEGSQGVALLNTQFEKASNKTRELRECLKNDGLLTIHDDLVYDRDTGLESPDIEILHSTIFWEPPLRPLGSELLTTLKYRNWKPFYIRIAPGGQTYFLGDQPIHVHFFSPEYKPQLLASSTPSDTEYVVIAKDLVEEYSLSELGFQFRSTAQGAYALDSRLTLADIEALVERSFAIRETNFRRMHRQLQWTPYNGGTVATEDGSETSSTSNITETTSWIQTYPEDDSQSEIELPPAPSVPTSPISVTYGRAPSSSHIAELQDVNLIDL
ncbi:hypothetical protein K491DRAFT_784054 [Lophiostoma macrostomum CBS 122681]|uniref:Fungal N-terminal domain-containing protein n=1 Tax=Lophiostoma macrostomum CBS 122681 TaxID=1314788 RepID=A0A6A6SNA4_9PLEO|nr:hypothetical protein K491DRAFT_784054 [Lophiostoma macrostomum CBS 122681]